jgi:hypothetical protein
LDQDFVVVSSRLQWITRLRWFLLRRWTGKYSHWFNQCWLPAQGSYTLLLDLHYSLYIIPGYPYAIKCIQWRHTEDYLIFAYQDDTALVWQVRIAVVVIASIHASILTFDYGVDANGPSGQKAFGFYGY